MKHMFGHSAGGKSTITLRAWNDVKTVIVGEYGQDQYGWFVSIRGGPKMYKPDYKVCMETLLNEVPKD